MYAYIKGIYEDCEQDSIVVEAGGIGYQMLVSQTTIDQLPSTGSEVKVYTYLHVREDAMLLFGFSSKEELELFKQLISVNGIGPKVGLAILSSLSTDELCFAIVNEDAKTIAKAPGIGPKTAKRLIIELKDKIHLEETSVFLRTASEPLSETESFVLKDAMEALISLGYSQAEAREVLKTIAIDPTSEVEDVLKEALKQLAFL